MKKLLISLLLATVFFIPVESLADFTSTFNSTIQTSYEDGALTQSQAGPNSGSRYKFNQAGRVTTPYSLTLPNGENAIGRSGIALSVGEQVTSTVGATTGVYTRGLSWNPQSYAMNGTLTDFDFGSGFGNCRYDFTLRRMVCIDTTREIGFSNPEQADIEIESTNTSVLDCSTGNCLAVSPGETTITIRVDNPTAQPFSNQFNSQLTPNAYSSSSGSLNSTGRFQALNVTGNGTTPYNEVVTPRLSYTHTPDRSLTVRVFTDDQSLAPEVVSTTILDSFSNGVRLGFQATDPQDDQLVGVNIQVATDSSFNNIVTNFSNLDDYSVTPTQDTGGDSIVYTNESFVSELDPNTVYYLRVRVLTEEDGWSDWGDVISFSTLEPTADTVTTGCSRNQRNYEACFEFLTGALSANSINSPTNQTISGTLQVGQGEDFTISFVAEGSIDASCQLGQAFGSTTIPGKSGVYTITAPNDIGVHTLQLVCSSTVLNAGSSVYSYSETISSAPQYPGYYNGSWAYGSIVFGNQGVNIGRISGGGSGQSNSTRTNPDGSTSSESYSYSSQYEGMESFNGTTVFSTQFTYTGTVNIQVVDTPDPIPDLTVGVDGGAQSNGPVQATSGQPLDLQWNVSNAGSVAQCTKIRTPDTDPVHWNSTLSPAQVASGSQIFNAPTVSSPVTYTYTLSCVKTAGATFTDSVQVEVTPPALSAQCTVVTPTVDNFTDVEINVEISGGIPDYTVEIDTQRSVDQVLGPVNIGTDLTYQQLYSLTTEGVGNYTPVVTIVDQAGSGSSIQATCSSVTNFGNRNIREVNP